jgi:hypothetical protein
VRTDLSLFLSRLLGRSVRDFDGVRVGRVADITAIYDLLVYVAYHGLALWSLVALTSAVNIVKLQSHLSIRMPTRFIGGFALAIAAFAALAWLAQIVPAVLSKSRYRRSSALGSSPTSSGSRI